MIHQTKNSSAKETPNNPQAGKGQVAFKPPAAFPKAASGSDVAQRQILRAPDVEDPSINLVNTLMQYTDYGTTFILLNGVSIPGGDVTTALAPLVFTERNAGENDVAVRIAAEPVITVGSRIALPAAPPWSAVSTLNNINVRIQGTGQGFSISDDFIGDNGASAATLEVHGFPNNLGFAALVRQHELHHVADINTAVASALTPWDTAIHNAIEADTEVHGATAEAAKTAFYAQLGGTPAQIGTAFRNRLRELGVAYHQTAQGGMPLIDSMTTHGGPGNFIIRVYLQHPMG